MKAEDILQSHSMPVFSPSYPEGPYIFKNREYLIITYETDPDALRAALPEPLEPAPGNRVFYEWMQLVGSNLENIRVHGAWEGEARLHLIPHVNCRAADLPVKKIIGGRHQIVDFTLPYGRVLHDYLA